MNRESQTVQQRLERLVDQAKTGDKDALEELVGRIQDRIYRLALRMLYYPADAEDASQEILIRIITHLDGFRGESSFYTWAYRIASNHLLTTRRRRAERWALTFEKYEEAIEYGLSYGRKRAYDQPEERLLVQEAKLACMQGMLLCLNREIRLAFILGEIFQVTGTEGAQILEITPESFRQRLSRGRKQLRNFLDKNCGVFNPENPCRCQRQLACDIEKRHLIDPQNLLFSVHPCYARENQALESDLSEIGEMQRVAVLFRSHPDYAAPENFVDIVKQLVASERFRLLGTS
jgi:RNA polymerase sigma factor (sigma-70 family)